MVYNDIPTKGNTMKEKVSKFVTDHKNQISAAMSGALVAATGAAFIANEVRKNATQAHKERQSIIDMVRGDSSTDK